MERMGEHLLVVEDDPEMRDLLRKVLEKEGFRVSLAADGAEAASLLARGHFDLVVTDLLMPRSGGLELLGTTRQDYPGLPVIIVTAFGDWHTYSQALELGALPHRPDRRDPCAERRVPSIPRDSPDPSRVRRRPPWTARSARP